MNGKKEASSYTLHGGEDLNKCFWHLHAILCHDSRVQKNSFSSKKKLVVSSLFLRGHSVSSVDMDRWTYRLTIPNSLSGTVRRTFARQYGNYATNFSDRRVKVFHHFKAWEKKLLFHHHQTTSANKCREVAFHAFPLVGHISHFKKVVTISRPSRILLGTFCKRGFANIITSIS